MRKKSIENSGLPEASLEAEAVSLSSDQTQAIMAKAQLRLLNYDFRSRLIDFKETKPEMTNAEQDQLKEILAESSGESLLPEETAEKILRNKQAMSIRADEMIDITPLFSQLSYAMIAKAEQAGDKNCRGSLQLAQKINDGIKDKSFPKISDFLPGAIIMGILKRETDGQVLPDTKTLAGAAAEDPEFLRACALALPEEAREEFLSGLPEEKRAVSRNIMDRELSKVLGQSKIAESEMAEREAVKGRLGDNLREILGGETESGQALLMEMISSLDNLGGEDSRRLLLEIGLDSLKKENDPIKSLTKNFQLAKLAKKLFEADQKLGGNLAMKFLARREVSDDLFRFMAGKLAKEKYLSARTENYLKEGENLPWLRKLTAQYPNQFNTVIETVSQLPDYRPAGNQEEIFEAIEDLGSLTPIIFKRYVAADRAGRKELALKIKSLKPRFFRNEPIAKILPKKDQDILAEMVYLAYKPVGMSFEAVRKMIDRLDDQTEDMEGYVFPKDGYDFMLAGEKKHELKTGEKTDLRQFSTWRDLFDAQKLKMLESEDQSRPAGKNQAEERDVLKRTDAERFAAALESIAKAKTEFAPAEIGRLLTPLAGSGLVEDFLSRYPRVNAENSFSFLSELQEIAGVFFKDNFSPKLEEFLSASENREISEKLAKILSVSKRQQTLERLMAGKLKADWPDISNPRILAGVLSQYIAEKVVAPWRSEIKKNLKKFQIQGGGAAMAAKSDLKAYVSKNIGSFFAKASAGICTAEDVGLFNRNDHFHINIVEKDENVRGNIQAYVIKDDGGRSLVLRGFNPNSEFLKNIDIEAFCEKVLDIGQQFVKDNGFKALYIADQGGWHALTNRTEVFNYLKRYLKERTAKNHQLQVSSDSSIGAIYKVS